MNPNATKHENKMDEIKKKHWTFYRVRDESLYLAKRTHSHICRVVYPKYGDTWLEAWQENQRKWEEKNLCKQQH